MIPRSSIAVRYGHSLAGRLQSSAAIVLLALYSAAVWHGTGDHHHHHAEADETACHSCTAHSCAPASAPDSPAGHDEEPLDAHECGLCILLHAPATPGVLAAAHALTGHAPAPLVAVTPSLSEAPPASPPSRAPPQSA